jgi:hypothetical protein
VTVMALCSSRIPARFALPVFCRWLLGTYGKTALRKCTGEPRCFNRCMIPDSLSAAAEPASITRFVAAHAHAHLRRLAMRLHPILFANTKLNRSLRTIAECFDAGLALHRGIRRHSSADVRSRSVDIGKRLDSAQQGMTSFRTFSIAFP